jgi:hypothetical protein
MTALLMVVPRYDSAVSLHLEEDRGGNLLWQLEKTNQYAIQEWDRQEEYKFF